MTESLYTLFGSLPASQTNSLLDARVAYDSVNQRFVIMAENLSGSTVSNIDMAVSKNSNPSDGWNVGSANSELLIGGSATQSDLPSLSVDGTNIYVSAVNTVRHSRARRNGFSATPVSILAERLILSAPVWPSPRRRRQQCLRRQWEDLLRVGGQSQWQPDRSELTGLQFRNQFIQLDAHDLPRK